MREFFILFHKQWTLKEIERYIVGINEECFSKEIQEFKELVRNYKEATESFNIFKSHSINPSSKPSGGRFHSSIS
jgi:hypothetical protein